MTTVRAEGILIPGLHKCLSVVRNILTMLPTLNLIKKIKINLTSGYIDQDQWSAGECDFEISPKDFLNFSKQDFKANDKRGFVNALTNAKRAIDCQTDKIFYCIGLDPNDFPNSIIESFISNSKNPPKKDLPIRLRFLQAIEFAPAKIVADVRNLRHDLEHFYKKPTIELVSSSIELAELFIQATDSKLRTMTDFYFTDTEKHAKSDGHIWDSIYIKFESKKKLFSIEGYVGKEKQRRINIKNSTEEYYYLLKIATSFDYDEDVLEAMKNWIIFLGHPIPRQQINFESS